MVVDVVEARFRFLLEADLPGMGTDLLLREALQLLFRLPDVDDADPILWIVTSPGRDVWERGR